MPTETAPLQAKLDADTSSLASHTAQLADIKLRLLKLEGVQPVPVPVPVPTPSPQLIWHAGMELGNLSEWAVPNNNTGSALSSAVQAAAEGIPARTPWVMKQAVTVNGSATRMGATSIVSQVKSGTPIWITWWDYYPAPIRFGPSDQYAIFQIAGIDAGGGYDPFFGFYLNGADGTPVVIWSPNDKAPAEGPHAGEAGKRTYTTSTPVPIGKWALFEIYFDASQNFAGALQFYMDRTLLLDLSQIRTRFPGTGDPGLPGYQYLEHLAYGAVGAHFLDDVTYSLGRMP